MERYRSPVPRLLRALGRHGLAAFFLALALALGLTAPGFLTAANFRSVGTQVPVNLIIAVGLTLVILTGGIDLSVGSVHALAGVVTAWVITNPELTRALGAGVVPAGVLCGLGAGAAVGVVNGYAVARFGLPSFIVTLATMRVCRGLAKQITGSLPIGVVDPLVPQGETINANLASLGWLGFGYVGGLVPVPLLLALAVTAVVAVALARTAAGRRVYAVGSSAAAARLSGVPVPRVQLGVYLLCSLFAALAGVVETAQLQSGSPIAGEGYELNAIAAVVVGGTSLSGGRGGVLGTLVGAVCIIGVMNNALNLYNVAAVWQEVASGAIIFFIVLLDQIARRRGSSPRP